MILFEEHFGALNYEAVYLSIFVFCNIRKVEGTKLSQNARQNFKVYSI